MYVSLSEKNSSVVAAAGITIIAPISAMRPTTNIVLFNFINLLFSKKKSVPQKRKKGEKFLFFFYLIRRDYVMGLA